jgi:hypothetical protein
MNKTDELYLNGRLVTFDESFNGWERVIGSYYITVQFKNDDADLEISVKKYDCVIGSKTIDIYTKPRIVEDEIANLICNNLQKTTNLEEWSNSTSDNYHYRKRSY